MTHVIAFRNYVLIKSLDKSSDKSLDKSLDKSTLSTMPTI